MSGYKINDLMYVFYWRNSSDDDWSISQPITLGELIDDAKLDFGEDDGSLPIHDIDWGHDEVRVHPVPPRRYAEATEPQGNDAKLPSEPHGSKRASPREQ